MDRYLLFVKTLFFLWIISVVISSEIAKRDVHRIVLKNRRPRSHRHHHHYHHYHGRNHGHHHGQNHGHRHGRHHSSYERDHSYENNDNSKYNSHENSYEELPNYKDHSHPSYNYYKPKPYSQTIELEEVRVEPLREEWKPLLSAENTILHHHDVTSHRTKRTKTGKKQHHIVPHLEIELTTGYTPKLPYPGLYDTTDFPPIGESFGNFNQKTIDAKQSPLMGSIKKPFTKSHQQQHVKNASYEVHESVKDDDAFDDGGRFQALVPLADTNTHLVAEATQHTSGELVAVMQKEAAKERIRHTSNGGDRRKPSSRGRQRYLH